MRDSKPLERNRMLRGRKPEKKAKRLKALIFGESGVGKTTLATQFPKPYVIDTERGSVNDQYVDRINASGGAVFHTTSFDEIVQEVRSLISVDHDFRTLVIDPVTVVYEDMLAHWERRVGSDYGRHFAAAKKEWRRLSALLSHLDMNVILTAHAKLQYADDGSFKVIGATYDGAKGTDYWVDLSLECFREDGKRSFRIIKSRIDGLKEGEVWPINYDWIASGYGGNLEGAAVTRDLVDHVDLEMVKLMLEDRQDGEALLTKWLRAAGVEELEDMQSDQVRRCIEWMQKN